MGNSVFPTLAGIKWDSKKTAIFSNKHQVAVSGKEIDAAFWAYPQWKWELSYELLRSGTQAELQTILGFFLCRYGSFDSFLYTDPEDCSVTAQAIGTGTGSLATFQLVRTYGGFTEPVKCVNATPTPAIYVGGVLRETAYSIGSTGLVAFTSPLPGNGVAVTATFNYYWRVRFEEDMAEFGNFAYRFWELKKITLLSKK